MLIAVESSVWLPAVTGAVGALLGAGASVGGSYLVSRQQDRQRREQRSAELTDRAGDARQNKLSEAASTLAQAFSLLHAIRMMVEATGASEPEELAAVVQHWTALRDRLFLLGVGYPETEPAEDALRLVGSLTEVVRSFSSFSERRSQGNDSALNESEDIISDVDGCLDLVMALLNPVRVRAGLPPIFSEELAAASARVSTQRLSASDEA